jgi:methylated-DNA-protein-cysteine methyltransferase-like protein
VPLAERAGPTRTASSTTARGAHRARTAPRRRLGGEAAASSEAGGLFERVYAAVRAIPRGRVATYGEVALRIGVARGARAVGWALRALPARLERDVPWHRVVGAGGRISPRPGPGPWLQRRLLLGEGVRFRGGRVDMARHGTGERGRAARTAKVPRSRARPGRARRGAVTARGTRR